MAWREIWRVRDFAPVPQDLLQLDQLAFIQSLPLGLRERQRSSVLASLNALERPATLRTAFTFLLLLYVHARGRQVDLREHVARRGESCGRLF